MRFVRWPKQRDNESKNTDEMRARVQKKIIIKNYERPRRFHRVFTKIICGQAIDVYTSDRGGSLVQDVRRPWHSFRPSSGRCLLLCIGTIKKNTRVFACWRWYSGYYRNPRVYLNYFCARPVELCGRFCIFIDPSRTCNLTCSISCTSVTCGLFVNVLLLLLSYFFFLVFWCQ